MNKRKRKKLLSRVGSSIEEQWHIRSLKPGDIMDDCDGFNHVIQRIVLRKRTYCSMAYHVIKYATYLQDGQERWFCGCGTNLARPYTQEEIWSSIHASYTRERIEEDIKAGWCTERAWKFLPLIEASIPWWYTNGVPFSTAAVDNLLERYNK